MMKRIMVVLTGCGRMDGSEIHESTLALLYIAQRGATYQCFAIDEPQVSVINHLNDSVQAETRNQLTEAARIARGDILALSQASAEEFDALVLPGGNGAFANWSQGPDGVHPELHRVMTEFADLKKPIATICIAPVLTARTLGSRGISLTIGNDVDTAKLIEDTGAHHVQCAVDQCVKDQPNRIVSTPAYMLGPGIADVAAGIEKTISTLLEWCE